MPLRFLFTFFLSVSLFATAIYSAPFSITEKAPSLEWKAVEDDHGGFYVVWAQAQGAQMALVAQHMSGAGQPVWSAAVALGASVQGREAWHAFRDAQGGVGVVWVAGGAVWGQVWDAAGQARWEAPLRISSATVAAQAPVGSPDAAGGFYVVWAQKNYGDRGVLLTQHVAANGRLLWNPEGLRVSLRPSDQQGPKIQYDGSAGFQVAWTDRRDGATTLRIQRMNFQGFRLWGLEGTLFVTPQSLGPVSASVQMALLPQGQGAAQLAWAGVAQGRSQIFEQMISSKGNVVPASSRVLDAQAEQWNPVVWGDGVGQTWLGWEDSRNLKSWQIYVRGPISERALAPSSADQGRLALAEDLSGGLWAVWVEKRTGQPSLFAQRLDSKGNPLFEKIGRAVAAPLTNPETPRLLPLLANQAVVLWADQVKKGEWTLSWAMLK